MPQNFPVEALEEICISLLYLEEGTAEGCIQPLNFARHMLPLVRRDHFYISGDEPELSDEEDTYFTREHPLDQAIMRLYVAVGTALDEYRSQAQDRYDDHIGAEETLEFGKDGTFAEIDQRSRDVSQDAEQSIQALSRWVDPNSIIADNLRRQLRDSSNVAHSVQSQIRIRPIVARWYEAAGMALGKLPDVLIKTADRLRLGTDIAKIWIEEWSAFKKRLRSLGFDQIRGLADALEATGERLKRSAGRDRTNVDRQRDPEIVEAERRVREMLLSGTEIPAELGGKVESVIFKHGEGKIRRFDDLLQLRNLQSLSLLNIWLDSGKLESLGQLSNLTSLSARAKDISTLAQLSNLTNLTLVANSASDLSALGGLSKLTRLSVIANGASDLSALGRLSNLTSLSVQADLASDLSALGRLSNLTSLAVQANSASDLSTLGRLSNLTSLSVQADSASDLSALGRLSNLTSLAVQVNSASDLSALGRLSNLTSLSVHANEAHDLSALGQLSNLTKLSVSANKARDLSALGRLSNLTRLNLQAAKVRDLAGLGRLTNLTSLHVQATMVSSLSELGRLSNLTSLSVHTNEASDISELGQLSNLTSLSVQAGKVNLAGIQELGKLAHLRIMAARDLDLAPAASVATLEKLTLSNVTFRNSALLEKVEIELVGESWEI
ncbi:Leucine-rich repeat (LRR) protein [Hoeflea marina]|uniref:Leucine-rich repeat (LRR) protein n=2 Tax=Hoeflea marina TaxID=274592 RepID=A0A317PGF7_9HYPH|nr:Leucine-rich repeat (LRR) protein [Hoeflea marina]